MCERLISDDEAQRNRAARKLLRLYRAEVGVTGGNLHIAVDDGNLTDEHLKFCLDRARGLEDWLGAACAAILLTMQSQDRFDARAFWWSV